MKQSTAVRVLTALITANKQSVFLWGPPGIGKSSIVQQVGKDLGLRVDVRLTSLMDPSDFLGIPSVDTDGRTRWCPPSWIPQEGSGILFLDELPQAHHSVQSAALQAPLERRIGDVSIAPGWRVVAAGNRVQDKAGAGHIISPLASRFIHLDLDTSATDWQRWAETAGIDARVRGFLQFRPELLMNFKPEKGWPRAFACPRTWEFVSNALNAVSQADLPEVLAGTVGDGPAAEFIGWLDIYRKLPDIDAMLADPSTFVPKTDSPAWMYAIVAALSNRAKDASSREVSAMYTIASMLPAEYSVALGVDILRQNSDAMATTAGQAWLDTNRAVITEGGNLR